MSVIFEGWPSVCRRLRERTDTGGTRLNPGQRRSVDAVAERFGGGQGNQTRGVIIADEVGMGKTRVASAVAKAVADAGGRVAILVPPGLQYQWRSELAGDDLEPPQLVHGLWSFLRGADAVAGNWLTAPALLVSHTFANWHMGPKTDPDRWGLLPALIAVRAGDTPKGWPYAYKQQRAEITPEVWGRAEAVYAHLKSASWTAALVELDEWIAQMGVWRTDYCQAKAYRGGGANREALERAVGWGLGRFDLVIVDEAHKARGEGSGLSRLLGHVVNATDDAAHLALTATPVALDISEWSGTLDRAGTPPATLAPLAARIAAYGTATNTLRGRWRTDEAARAGWTAAAAGYQGALRPYVLRRDKSEDHHVRAFAEGTGVEHAYRRTVATVLRPADLSPAWRQVVLAAEALSAATLGTSDGGGKRLRLTLANGHGVSSLIARLNAKKNEQALDDAPLTVDAKHDPKRAARSTFWSALIGEKAAEAATADTALFRHPQLVRAVSLIEDELGGEKVLVFGRFTAPLQALSALLNARAKLRSANGTSPVPWPAESLGLAGLDGKGSPVVPSEVDVFAAGQLNIDPSTFPALEARHAERFRAFETRRAWFRRSVGAVLGRAADLSGIGPGLRALLRAAAGDHTSADEADAPLARALWEMLAEPDRELLLDGRDSPDVLEAIAGGFRDLVGASTDQDGFDETEEQDTETAAATWQDVRAIIAGEFSRTRGSFARLLDGSTEYPTRRLLQAAFNRQNSFPRVLIAQSIVGREGLNLHEACRVVLLLHPEWNPGVVEQQIGRVDRLGSHWSKAIDAAIQQGTPATDTDTGDIRWPQIEVHSIIFGGTYDEHQWGVLNRRWADLRAQLHGVVIPPGEVGDESEDRRIAAGLNATAPRFGP